MQDSASNMCVKLAGKGAELFQVIAAIKERHKSTATCTLGPCVGQTLAKTTPMLRSSNNKSHCAETVPQVLGRFRDRLERNNITFCKSIMNEPSSLGFLLLFEHGRYSATVIFPLWQRMVTSAISFLRTHYDLDRWVN